MPRNCILPGAPHQVLERTRQRTNLELTTLHEPKQAERSRVCWHIPKRCKTLVGISLEYGKDVASRVLHGLSRRPRHHTHHNNWNGKNTVVLGKKKAETWNEKREQKGWAQGRVRPLVTTEEERNDWNDQRNGVKRRRGGKPKSSKCKASWSFSLSFPLFQTLKLGFQAVTAVSIGEHEPEESHKMPAHQAAETWWKNVTSTCEDISRDSIVQLVHFFNIVNKQKATASLEIKQFQRHSKCPVRPMLQTLSNV